MAQIAIEELEVVSFFTDEAPEGARAESYYYTDAKDCEYTLPEWECICTGDFSTCSRTSVEGGCDTSVQCVTVG